MKRMKKKLLTILITSLVMIAGMGAFLWKMNSVNRQQEKKKAALLQEEMDTDTKDKALEDVDKLELQTLYLPEKQEATILLVSGGSKIRLRLRDLLYAETDGHYLIFHTTTGQLQQKASLSSLAGHLGDSFVMSHRSFYVNLAHLLRISRTECTLDTGLTVPVSRGAYKNLNEQFIRYYRKEMLE